MSRVFTTCMASAISFFNRSAFTATGANTVTVTAMLSSPGSTRIEGWAGFAVLFGPFDGGLIFLDGFLYEGTGLNGRSGLRKVNLDNGRVLQQKPIEEQYFGEGITEWGNELIQLTWQSGVGFVWDRTTFQRKRQFKYAGEGWGLTHDTQRLIMSDGSPVLRFLDPKTQAETGRIVVLDGRRPIANLSVAGRAF